MPAEPPPRWYVVTILTELDDPEPDPEPGQAGDRDEIRPGLTRHTTFGPFATRKAARFYADQYWSNLGCYGLVTELRHPDANLPHH